MPSNVTNHAPSDLEKKQARAYIFSSASELRNFGSSGKVAGVVELKVMGKTPAYKVRRVIEIFAAPYPVRDFVSPTVGAAEDTLGQGIPIDLGPVYLSQVLTPDQVSQITNGVMAIYVVARVEYVDAFNDKHSMSFRSYFRGNGTPIPEGATLALARDGSGGNLAD